MDQDSPRVAFNQAFHEFINCVELNNQFMSLLNEHPCRYLLPSLEHFPDDMAKKCRIFSEFTLVRDNTERLAEALEQSGQGDAAKQLRMFNLSEKPWQHSDDIYLQIKEARFLRSNASKDVKMDTNPRGVALIFVTVPDLALEGERFRSICEQLLFVSHLHENFNKTQVEAKLKEQAQLKTKYKGDAFVMIFIGHGYDEKIIGWSANPKWPPSPGDVLPISDIVAMFSETRCRALRQKSKLFIFNCCRITTNELPETHTVNNGNGLYRKSESIPVRTKYEPNMIDTLVTLDPVWKRENRQTYVIYACAEGIKTWYDKVNGTIGHVSAFGQVLSHTIAQYAWYKSLYQQFLMTVERLEEQLETKGLSKSILNIKIFAMDRELFLNPGQWKEDIVNLSD